MHVDEVRCTRCGHVIPWFTPHVRLDIVLLNGNSSSQRFCDACCHDPRVAVLFQHVMDLPVKNMNIVKVWA